MFPMGEIPFFPAKHAAEQGNTGIENKVGMEQEQSRKNFPSGDGRKPEGQEGKQEEEYQQVKAVVEKTLKSGETGSLGLTLSTSYAKAEDPNILVTQRHVK